jgi:methyltransferase-like protein 22
MESVHYHDNNITEVSSDVHIERDFWIADGNLFASRYEISLPPDLESTVSEDLNERKRRRRRNSCYIIMHHVNSSSLDDVGKQLWRGAFLLSDYLIHMQEQLRPKTLVELGCGVGFASMVASLLPCQCVYMTDANASLIDLAMRNVERNNHLLPLTDGLMQRSPVKPRVLDWLKRDNSRDKLDAGDSWSEADIQHFNSDSTDIIWLAADVIYDDELTEAFFQTAKRMMRSGEHLWMAMEKRFNFSIEEMSVVAHGYKRLMKYVSDVDGAMPFRGSRIPLSFSQRVMSYDRVVDLEMWDIVKI